MKRYVGIIVAILSLIGIDAKAERAPGPMCIEPSAEQALSMCPEGAKRARIGQGKAPRSRLKEVPVEKDKAAKRELGPTFEIDLSTRMGRDQKRVRTEKLLRKEIGILARLIKNRGKDDPQRPDVLVRLAETQFELQLANKASIRAYDEPIYQACVVSKDKKKCREARDGQKRAKATLKKTRTETVQTYAILVRDHPNYRNMDEALFALAFSLEEAKDHERARKVYHRLIKDYPKSRFIPHAYLSFAEHFFLEGDMPASAKFYKRVLRYPPKRNSVYGFALYKLGWVEYNRERYKDALKRFVELLDFARSNPYATDAKNLARQARKELVLPYSRVGTPNKALAFFRRYAKTNAEAHVMLGHLADLYFDTGQWRNAITTYHILMSSRPDDEQLCEWQGKVTRAVISSRGKPEQVKELSRLSNIAKTYSRSKHPAEKINECRTEAATALTWLATSWHREAVGNATQPGTRSKKTMRLAAQLYKKLLADYPDMERMEFPKIDRRDWPTPYKLAYFNAELLWKMEAWNRCGPAFDKVVEMNPRGEFASDAAYAAVLCYNNLYKQQYKPRERQKVGKKRWYKSKNKKVRPKFAARDFNPLEKGMLEAFSRYVCYVDKSDELVKIKYQRARIYYESNHFDEAAILFKDIAFNHKDSELSEYAANLYLDCLNILGTQVSKPRAACVTQLSNAIEPMAGTFCSAEGAAEAHPDLCGTLQTLQCQVKRKQAENYEKNKEYKQAASTYVRIMKEHKGCGEDLDEMLYNAAINYEAAHLLGSAIRVRKVLIDKFPNSKWAKRAIYLTGANYHALAYYEEAANYYEQFARRFSGEDGKQCSKKDRDAGLCPNAVEALENAVFFRLGLVDDKKAIDDADLFARNYRRRMPRQTAQVVYSVGSVYERQERWNDVIKHYKRYLKNYARSALPHQRAMANTTIGRAYWKLGQRSKARPYYQAAVNVWKRGAAKRIAALRGVQDGDKMRYTRQALDAAAEAQFHLAEKGYESFTKVAFPRYRGGRSLKSVNKWSKGVFKLWVRKKLAALRKAEAQYAKIAKMRAKFKDGRKLESAPWQIAAAARIGQMYRSFVDDFRDAPIPKQIEKDVQLFDVYVGALDEESEPLKKQAMDKFEFCLKTATNVRWFNEWSRTCETELNQLNPTKYPVAAELRGEPNYVKSTLGVTSLQKEGTKDCKSQVKKGLKKMDNGDSRSAKKLFEAAIKEDPQCTSAYTNLAIIQRASNKPSERAEGLKNLRRALAIESDYLPAFNQMALYYYELGKKKRSKAAWDLGEVVCRQAQLIDPKYAPIYNTWGLIRIARGDVIEALRFFEEAIRHDPKLFEAQMNFAEVTLSFRGYQDAQAAFARAVDLRSKDYDAQIGLGAAYRGLENFKEAQSLYERARGISEKRPEAYFNLGVLYQDYMSGSVADLKRSRGYFEQFLKRAGSKAGFKKTVKSVKAKCQRSKKKRRGRSKCRPGRLQNIDESIKALSAVGG